MVTSGAEPECDCKLGRVAEDWNLEAVEQELVTDWRENSESLRSLAATFNRELLRRAMTEAGNPPLEGEVSNYYRLLTNDDVSRGMRTQATNRLAENGVDVKSVKGDFVSYQTVNRHLKNCVGVFEEDRTRPLGEDEAKDRVYSLQHRTREVTHQTLTQLRRSQGDPFEDFEVYVNISAQCSECGAQLGLEELLEGETCRCPD